MSKEGRGPSTGQTWTEKCSNKRQKKQNLSGGLVKPGRPSRRTRRASSKIKADGPTALEQRVESLCECFSDVPDPRVNRRRRHLLLDVIVIATLAVIANADTWKDIQIWGQTHREWLGTFLALPNGIPSRDTLRRTISRIDPQQFQKAFLRWMAGLRKGIQGVIAIDGKTLRGSKWGEQGPLHIVSAWASEQHLTLGQRQVDGKSNEITAIPELLRLLELKGAIVTIDAMGCQKEIAATIVERKGHYCLAVKGNQETLATDIAASFETAFEMDFRGQGQQQFSTIDKQRPHGRVETREYFTLPVSETLRTRADWAGLKSIGLTITYRGQGSAAAEDGEVRYYIMSFDSNVEQFANAVRQHWGIENSLHWVMDVTFREDESRIHKDHGGENVSWLRRLAITLIKNDTSLKDSIRAKRIRAGYDRNYLQTILEAIPQ
jgi:predicted transposase YbfD/YdcC